MADNPPSNTVLAAPVPQTAMNRVRAIHAAMPEVTPAQAAVGVGSLLGVTVFGLAGYGAWRLYQGWTDGGTKPLTTLTLPSLPSFGGARQLSRAENAAIIRQGIQGAGFSAGIAIAAIANAIAESNLNNLAHSPGSEDSRGLFQINSLGGRRTFTGDRYDPHYSVAWIIENELRTSSANYLLQRDREGASPGELAAIFGRDIERPQDRVTGGPMWRRRWWLGDQIAQGALPDNGAAFKAVPA